MMKQITIIICDISLTIFDTFAGYFIVIFYGLYDAFFSTILYEKKETNRKFAIGAKWYT